MVVGTSLTDPSGSNALAEAARWMSSLLLGSVATIVATLALAAIGFGMLQGRLPIRRGIVVIMGCFIIFGATAVAGGLMDLSFARSDRSPRETPVASTSRPPAVPSQPQVYDPYAGASVPIR